MPSGKLLKSFVILFSGEISNFQLKSHMLLEAFYFLVNGFTFYLFVMQG